MLYLAMGARQNEMPLQARARLRMDRNIGCVPSLDTTPQSPQNVDTGVARTKDAVPRSRTLEIRTHENPI